MNEAQKKIESIVLAYKGLFPAEFQAVKEIVKKKRDNQKKDTGDMTKMTDAFNRPMHEIPQSLHVAITMKLTPEETVYFQSMEGTRWFTKKFREFSLISKI